MYEEDVSCLEGQVQVSGICPSDQPKNKPQPPTYSYNDSCQIPGDNVTQPYDCDNVTEPIVTPEPTETPEPTYAPTPVYVVLSAYVRYFLWTAL